MTLAVLTRESGWNTGLHPLVPAGAEVVEVPVTETLYVSDSDVRLAVERLGDPARYRWLVVTSVRAQRAVAAVGDLLSPALRTAVVGEATATALREIGRDPDVVGDAGSQALASAIDEGPVLFLGAAEPRAELADELGRRALALDSVAVYQTRGRALSDDERAVLERADVVFVAAPSAWRVLREYVTPSALLVVPGETTAHEIGRDHAVVVGFDDTTASRIARVLSGESNS